MPIKDPVSKRLFDLGAGTLALLVASPLMAVAAILIALEQRAKPIFTQRRTGLGGSEFTIYKFRTMAGSPLRVTPLGKILRNTSIDELPQLFNVIAGTMSLVGPRPQTLDHLPYYGARIPDYHKRLQMKPGITGLMQITPLRYRADSVENYRKGTRYEIYYINHWSLGLDLWICWRTIRVLLNPRIIFRQGQYFEPQRAQVLDPETRCNL